MPASRRHLGREKEIGKRRSPSIANLSLYCMGSHTGTHLDLPFFLPDGDTAESLPLDSLIGPAVVVEAPMDEIGRDFLAGAGLGNAERVLLKTRNSAFSQGHPVFREEFAHLTPDGARIFSGAGREAGGDRLPFHRKIPQARNTPYTGFF